MVLISALVCVELNIVDVGLFPKARVVKTHVNVMLVCSRQAGVMIMSLSLRW